MKFSKQSGIYRLYSQQFFPISIKEAWSFFYTPQNLQKITLENLNFRMNSPEKGEAYLGQIITYSIRLNKVFKMNLVTEITYIAKGKSFVDEQRFGPYKMWHHLHNFEKVDRGVLMTDIVHFKLPFYWIAPIIYSLFVKRNLTTIFNHRITILNTLISSNKLL